MSRLTQAATDRIRETLFAILEPRLEGSRVLDLFAGAGTLGIEALSRGAAHATFVERAAPALLALRANLASTGLTERSRVVAMEATRFAEAPGGPYDLMLCDPPFADAPALRELLALPALRAALAPRGLIVYRAHRKGTPDLDGVATAVREKVIGEEVLCFVRYDARTEGGPTGG